MIFPGKTKIANAFSKRMQSREKPENHILSWCLYVPALLYCAVVRIRVFLYKTGWISSVRLPLTVISVGNLSTGGTGKTPFARYLAENLVKKGYTVAIASRGYRGKWVKTGGVVSDGKTVFAGPEEAGDEPFLLARTLKGVPVLVGKNRVSSGMTAVSRFHAGVLILDDGFQHLKLQRNLDIVLVDDFAPFGNGHLLPKGPLREPVSALLRGDILVRTRCGETPSRFFPLKGEVSKKPVFCTTHAPHIAFIRTPDGTEKKPSSSFSLSPGRVVGFSGIAGNEGFQTTLADIPGLHVAEFFPYPDHHRYTEKELFTIAASARENHADAAVTTLKDYCRITCHPPWPCSLMVMDVNIRFTQGENSFWELVEGCINAQQFHSAK